MESLKLLNETWGSSNETGLKPYLKRLGRTPEEQLALNQPAMEWCEERLNALKSFMSQILNEGRRQRAEGLRERVLPYGTDGRFELFKSSKKFDADVGRRQHGFPTQDQLPT